VGLFECVKGGRRRWETAGGSEEVYGFEEEEFGECAAKVGDTVFV
jgi:hypothetical protein